MDAPSSPPASPGPVQSGQVRLVQRGKGTFTGTGLRKGIWVTWVHNWGEIRDLGEFDSVESALAAADEALKKDPQGIFMVVNDQELVLAEKLDVKLHQKLEDQSERRIKTVVFLVCALAVGATFHACGAVSTWSAVAFWMAGFYLLLWLFGSTANPVESCFIAIILTTIACLLFPTLDVISKAEVRAYLKKEQRERDARARRPVTP